MAFRAFAFLQLLFHVTSGVKMYQSVSEVLIEVYKANGKIQLKWMVVYLCTRTTISVPDPDLLDSRRKPAQIMRQPAPICLLKCRDGLLYQPDP